MGTSRVEEAEEKEDLRKMIKERMGERWGAGLDGGRGATEVTEWQGSISIAVQDAQTWVLVLALPLVCWDLGQAILFSGPDFSSKTVRRFDTK